jgi:hypothetical protein
LRWQPILDTCLQHWLAAPRLVGHNSLVGQFASLFLAPAIYHHISACATNAWATTTEYALPPTHIKMADREAEQLQFSTSFSLLGIVFCPASTKY